MNLAHACAIYEGDGAGPGRACGRRGARAAAWRERRGRPIITPAPDIDAAASRPSPLRRIGRAPGLRLVRAAALGLAVFAALTASTASRVAAQSLIRDAEIEATLKRLTDPIFRAAGLPEGAINIYIVNALEPNAFVFSGRSMAITTGMLRSADNPGQIQAVVAHEAGHITGGHLARRAIMAQNLRGPALLGLLVTVAAAAAGGGVGAGAGAAMGSQAVVQRMFAAHSRGEESAADQAAMTYLERAGIDPKGMAEVLERFRGQDVFTTRYQDPYAMTHPISSERLGMIEQREATSPDRGKPPDPTLVYWFDRMIAKLDAFIDRPRTTLARIKPDDRSELGTMKRAIAFHRLPDPARALDEANALIAIRPRDPYYHELKGQILMESGRGPEAVTPLREAVKLAPDEPLILGSLGRALISVNTDAADREAIATLERATARSEGGSPGMLHDLAYAYARTGQEGKAALASAERLAMSGRAHDARIQARRAKSKLPKGSPPWIRADDILASLPNE